MQRYEYEIINHESDCWPDNELRNKLDRIGRLGWEMVAYTNPNNNPWVHRIVFKRPL